jgi:hypothetical protein
MFASTGVNHARLFSLTHRRVAFRSYHPRREYYVIGRASEERRFAFFAFALFTENFFA